MKKKHPLDDLDEDIRDHLERETQENIERGMSPDEARAAARRAFGSVTLAKEHTRAVWVPMWLQDLLQDLRYAFRQLRRSPGFTVAAILTLAIGIGANAAVFSVVDHVLLRPLPFAQADRLLALCSTNAQIDGFCVASPPDVEDVRHASRTISNLAVARPRLFLRTTSDGPRAVSGAIATPSLFNVFGIRPALGRLPAPTEVGPGADIVVLSYSYWRDQFGANPNVLGKTLTLDGQRFRIVGVLPADVRIPRIEKAQVWAPLPFAPRDEENRDWRGFLAFGRLAPGASLEAMQDELAGIAGQLARRYPNADAGWGINAKPLLDEVVGPVRPTLLLFLGAVGLVLLVGCANIANLLLARASARRRELAIRMALGGSRGRLVRMWLTESLVLTTLGSLAGILLAASSLRAFLAVAPAGLPRMDHVAIGGRVLVFAIAAGLMCCLLVAIPPVLQASHIDINQALKGNQATQAGDRGGRLRSTFIVAEVTLAVVLLVGAGLVGRSFVNMLQWHPGFELQHLLTLQLFVPQDKYPEGAQVASLYQRAITRIASYPGVVRVGAASAGPLFGGRETDNATVDGAGAARGVVRYFDISPGYWPAMGIPTLAGRDFTDGDDAASPMVAMINETMARRFWPGESPIGRSVTLREQKRTFRIVGVVRDVPPIRAGQPVEPQMYWPDAQVPRWATFLVIRTTDDPARLIPDVRHLLAQVEPGLQVLHISPMPALADAQLVQPRFAALLIGIFAALAALLAAIGIYGVTAYSVAQRTAEFGVRLALGAGSGRIVQAVLRQEMLLVLVGLLLGLVGAAASSRLIASLLAGVRATDPSTFAAVAVLTIVVGLLACYLPARRASRVDPMVTLRGE